MSAAEDRGESLRMIRDSAAGLAPRTGDFRRIRALRFTEPGFDRAVFRDMCQMGWLGLMLPEDAGGSGLGVSEFCALSEELGASLVPEPLIGAAMAARLLPADHLPEVLGGERIVLLAWQERPHGLDFAGGGTVVGNGRVTGKKLFIGMAAGADAFVVTTRDGLALVERSAPGVRLDLTQTQDGGNAGTLTLDEAPAEIIAGDGARLGGAGADVASAMDSAIMATSAYLLGVMDRVFGITVEYLKTREQFGRKIGSFQALQHRSADLAIQIALTRATVQAAAMTYDSGTDVALRRAAVSRAKARASEAASLVTRGCIQLHGGIGYTDAADPGLFLRKMMVLAPSLGSASLHRARFRTLMPDSEED